MHRICINRHKTRLSKNFKRFWCAAATACQPQKTVFSASFTGCPSTVTFYEVKLQQLLLHQRHNFQKWCRNSRLAGSWSGRYYPPEGGGINRTCLKEQKPASAALRGFCYIYFFYISSPSLPFSRLIPRFLLFNKLGRVLGKFHLKMKKISKCNIK